jgi:hypothetical protein
MSKTYFTLRWTSAFLVLGAFSFVSLSNLFHSHASALANNFQQVNAALPKSEHYLTLEEGQKFNKFAQKQTVCTLTQNQFDNAKRQFNAKAVTLNIEGDPVSLAEIVKSGGYGQGEVLKELGVNPSDCKTINSSKAFYLYLVPGVS